MGPPSCVGAMQLSIEAEKIADYFKHITLVTCPLSRFEPAKFRSNYTDFYNSCRPNDAFLSEDNIVYKSMLYNKLSDEIP